MNKQQDSAWERGRPRPHAGETPALQEQDTSLVISCRDLTKTYTLGKLEVPVLKGVNLDVRRGERVAIVGASGSGKSTLLHLLGGLDNASGGSAQILGQEVQQMNETQRGELRNRSLGFIYQFHHLLPEFTALENVAMPLLIRGMKRAEAEPRAAAMLEQVGLAQRLHHHPSELSGGERQRVAVARALVTEPACLLADEPTGNLDSKTSEEVMELFKELNTFGQTVVMVTHNPENGAYSDRTINLKDGAVVTGPV